ncbi:uncharacterized protein EMH_0063920 [Eimeria mitis]|uniref:Snurportin-1 n=1 Tax=Eimeria mitis TaxID=44415 RepID=U6K022_9EIME|nr:uncharacterized protein EMH_0063920 [Eimeria mitis]CDJ31085.1 hypothetical protein, conserved [Eimeria mitis]
MQPVPLAFGPSAAAAAPAAATTAAAAAAAAAAEAVNGVSNGQPGGPATPLQVPQQQQQQQQQHSQQQGMAESLGAVGSSKSSRNSSSNSSSSSSSCCGHVYAERQAAFKSHPAAETMRQQRLEMNSILRSGARAELLQQLRAETERQLRQHSQQQGMAESLGAVGSSKSSRNSSSNSSSSSCCGHVYAERQAAFKSHPAAETMRQQRLEMNSILRSGARAELLQQLRAETERQLRQQEELLQQQQHDEEVIHEHQQQQQQQQQQRRYRSSCSRNHSEAARAPLECMDSRPLQQLITQPQALYEPPEDFKSGDYMVGVRPEGRSCLLLLRGGRGYLYGKNGRPLLRVQCSSKWQQTAGAAARAGMQGGNPLQLLLRQQQQQQQQQHELHRLPLGREEIQEELEKEIYYGLPACEKQQQLLQLSRGFDVSLYGGVSASQAEDCMQQDQQQQQQQQQQQRGILPLLYLPMGVLSKGLTLLECVLCPYTRANMHCCCVRYAEAEGDAAAAAAAAAAATAAAAAAAGGGEEEPLWQVLFVADVLFLGGLMLGHCDFECRHFFIRSRGKGPLLLHALPIEETPEAFAPLQLLPFAAAAASELQSLVAGGKGPLLLHALPIEETPEAFAPLQLLPFAAAAASELQSLVAG